MRLLFVLLILSLAASDVFSAGMSLGPGLSVKNALLYPIALGLMFRLATSGRFRLRLPAVNIAFILWIAYATLTWIACITVIHYPGYPKLETFLLLKSVLVDSGLFFFVYFYGIESEVDFLLLARTLAFAIGMANILTLADVAGIVHLGVTIGTNGVEADRLFGVFGHANDTGELIVTLLPLLIAVASSSRGLPRLFWYLGAFASFAVLILTVSRGAYVGLALGYGAALWMCRRYLPTSRVITWVLVGLSCIVLAVALGAIFMPDMLQVLSERLFNQSMAMSTSVASSGRTTMWAEALSAMMAHPVTFLTGFGWRVEDTMFELVTHNEYLDEWFSLGLVGLFAFLTILYMAIATPLRALEAVDSRLRPYLIALVFGVAGLAVCSIFANLDKPASYIWIYVGLTLRMASDVLDRARGSAAAKERVAMAGANAQVTLRAAPGVAGGVRR
jgi:O-antigen ligase